MAKDITLKTRNGETRYPKSVTALIYENGTGKTLQTIIDEMRQVDAATNTRTQHFKADVNNLDTLKNKTDIGLYNYVGTGWRGSVSVCYDSADNVSQVALSSSTPSYNGNTLTWLSAQPCAMARTYTNGAWSHWEKVGAPVVNDLTTGGTDKALSAEMGKTLKEGLDALGPEIFKDTKTISLTQLNVNANISVDTGKIVTSSDTYAHVYYAAVTQGERVHITASNSEAKSFKHGFTAATPAVDVDVIAATSLSTDALDVVLTSPVNGYIVIYRYGSYFSDVVLKENVSRIDEIDIVKGDVAILSKKMSKQVTGFASLNGSVLEDGTFGTGSTYKHAAIPVTEGDVIMLVSDVSSCRYAFATSNASSAGENVPLVSGTSVVSMPEIGRAYIVTIPAGCTYLLFNLGTGSATRCYKIESFSDALNGVDAEFADIKSRLKWQLYPMPFVAGVGIGDASYTESTSASKVVYYMPVTAGDVIKLDIATTDSDAKFCFSTDVPEIGGSCVVVSGINTVGVHYLKAPISGYFALRRAASSADYYVYVVRPDVETYVPHDLGVTYTANRGVNCTPSSDAYGNVVSLGSSNWGVTDAIDISGYDYIIGKVNYATSSFSFDSLTTKGGMFYDENNAPLMPLPVMRSKASRSQTDCIFKIPSGAKYVRLFAYIASTPSPVYGLNRVAGGDDSKSGTSIFDLNPDLDILPKMVIAKKKKNNGENGSSTIPPLVFAHISDVHGKKEQYSRFIEFANYWKQKGYIDELIDTGDLIAADWLNNFGSWRNQLEGYRDIMFVIGNHDVCASADEMDDEEYPAGQNKWQYHSAISLRDAYKTHAYNRYMLGPDSSNPIISGWGVTQPENAAANGLCYYYKDYPDNKIRLIALDVMAYNQDQNTWLAARLAETRDSSNSAYDYHVLIMIHFPGSFMTRIDCNYSSLFGTASSGIGISTYNSDCGNIAITVDAFQNNGGAFIGYVCGHYHRDMINRITAYPNQLVYSISSGGMTPIRDFTKTTGSKSYDDFQIVSVNTYDKTVRLIKIGADTDYYMRKKGTICISYDVVDGAVKGVIGEGW